jgi:hypothetical protein
MLREERDVDFPARDFGLVTGILRCERKKWLRGSGA